MMNHIFRYIAVISLLSFVVVSAKAQLLYEISGNGAKQKSYLLGTNRLVEMQFLDTIPNVFKCFSQCNKVITEFTMQDYEAISALRQAALLPDSVKLSNFYSETEYEYIDNSLRITLGMGLDKLCRMKPSYLTEMYRVELMKQWLQYDEQKSMESLFESVAAERDIPVIGLDNIGETMYMLFDREPFHWQCKELLKVPKLGAKTFEQAAGFLRLKGKNPLDNSAVHPESYAIVERMAKDQGCSVADLIANKELRDKIDLNRYVTAEVGLPTLTDIMKELAQPGRDPRGETEEFAFDASVHTIDDLQAGMVLPGIVTNISAFGAFVDVGVHKDGLVHISEMADRRVTNPQEVVKLHQHVKVRVVDVDRVRGRIQLSLRHL